MELAMYNFAPSRKKIYYGLRRSFSALVDKNGSTSPLQLIVATIAFDQNPAIISPDRKVAMEPSTKVTTEYILTLHVPLDPPQIASDNLQIFNIRPGGWVNGLIRGEVIAPGADWLRIMSDGTRRLDVRLSIKTHDDAIIFVAYQGRATAAPPDVAQRLADGETLGPDQIYF